jgi:hypothetical protein
MEAKVPPEENGSPQCNLLDLDEVISKLNGFKPTTDHAAVLSKARKLYVRAALVIHPDKNADSLKQQTNFWFNALCEAWERCEARLKSPAPSESPTSSTSEPPASSASGSAPPRATRNTCATHLAREAEQRKWTAWRKEKNPELAKLVGKPEVKETRVMTPFVTDDNMTRIRLTQDGKYTYSQLIIKLKTFKPLLDDNVSEVFLLWRFTGEHSENSKFYLIGESKDDLFVAYKNAEVYVLFSRLWQERSCSDAAAAAKRVVNRSKPKKAKPKKCQTCDYNWKTRKPELQECCMCKQTFHRGCMPVWFGRESRTKDSQSWYAFTAGTRTIQGQKWSNTPVPGRYNTNPTMPALNDGDGYQLRFDFLFLLCVHYWHDTRFREDRAARPVKLRCGELPETRVRGRTRFPGDNRSNGRADARTGTGNDHNTEGCVRASRVHDGNNATPVDTLECAGANHRCRRICRTNEVC